MLRVLFQHSYHISKSIFFTTSKISQFSLKMIVNSLYSCIKPPVRGLMAVANFAGEINN